MKKPWMNIKLSKLTRSHITWGADAKIARKKKGRRGSKTPGYLRRMVFIRDNWTCQICGLKMLKSWVGTNHDRRPTVDHIKPFCLGGKTKMSNLQAACHRCNNKKGNSFEEENRS